MRDPSQIERFTVRSRGTNVLCHRYGDGAALSEPAVILCAGFSGTQDTPAIVAAAVAFAEAGIQTVTFDYRGFGQSDGMPRQVVSVADQLDDVRAVLARVRTMPSVDPTRVALWGSSLGGAHALTISAQDQDVAAVVAQVPFNGFPPHTRGRSQRDSFALLWTALRDRFRGWTGRPPIYVKAVGRTQEQAVMVGSEANATIKALSSATWRNQVAPRGLLDMVGYRPGRTMNRIVAPVLICLAAHDDETTASTTMQLARSAPNGRQLSYPATHFEIYRPEIRSMVLRDQTAFLVQALGAD
ncbi:MAG TPA: alpha/beta hydrolase [Microbacterium sp.]|nr:alpha/beta hydrolase [Microbacterium sp.]